MTVTVNDKATGLVKFQVTGAEEYVVYSDVVNGKAVLEDILLNGNYAVTVTYMGDTRFNTNITHGDFNIKGNIRKNTPITAYAEVNGNRVTLTVNVDKNATGFVKLIIGDTVANIEVDGGVATYTTNLLPNSYFADVTYLGDDLYNMNNTKLTFTVIDAAKVNTAIDLNITVNEDATAKIMVNLDETTTGLVKFYMISKETSEDYTMYMDVKDNQVELLTDAIEPGDYTVVATYMGDSKFNTNITSFDFTVNKVEKPDTTIIASNITRGYNSGLDYTATLLDAKGSPLANTFVTLKVGTNTYSVQTDSNGVLRFNNRLAVGDYPVVIVNPVTGEYKLTNMKIVGRITENRDVSIFFADNSNYRVRIVGDDGNYVGAGETVSINVGGKTYSVKTDANGYANLKLSLKVKKHTITVTYKGFTTKNTVTVKSVVKPVKKTVKVKKTAKKLKIKVKLKGKKVLKKKRVYLKFKGKTYKAKTNKKGIATFKVPKKVIKKLKKGKKYKAVFTYKAKANGKTIKNTAKGYVKVRK